MDALLRNASISEVARIRQEVEQEYRDAGALADQGKTMADVESGLNRQRRISIGPAGADTAAEMTD